VHKGGWKPLPKSKEGNNMSMTHDELRLALVVEEDELRRANIRIVELEDELRGANIRIAELEDERAEESMKFRVLADSVGDLVDCMRELSWGDV
jgi:hypothetical protein